MRSKQDTEMRALERRIKKIREVLGARLRARGIVFEWSAHRVPRLSIEHYDVCFGLRPMYDHTGSGRISDRLTMCFGDSRFERAVVLVESKAGYDVDWVADLLMARHAREVCWASMQADATKAAGRNAQAADCINRDLKLDKFVYEGGLVEKLGASGHGQGIRVVVDLVCDEFKARSILGWVREQITSGPLVYGRPKLGRTVRPEGANYSGIPVIDYGAGTQKEE